MIRGVVSAHRLHISAYFKSPACLTVVVASDWLVASAWLHALGAGDRRRDLVRHLGAEVDEPRLVDELHPDVRDLHVRVRRVVGIRAVDRRQRDAGERPRRLLVLRQRVGRVPSARVDVGPADLRAAVGDVLLARRPLELLQGRRLVRDALRDAQRPGVQPPGRDAGGARRRCRSERTRSRCRRETFGYAVAIRPAATVASYHIAALPSPYSASHSVKPSLRRARLAVLADQVDVEVHRGLVCGRGQLRLPRSC